MSEPNANGTAPHPQAGPGVLPQTVKEAREFAELVRWQNQCLRARAERKILENWYSWDDFNISGEYERRVASDLPFGIAPATPSDRRSGANYPIWRTEVELNRFRQESRILCRHNAFAISLQRNLVNYIVGRGYGYKVGAIEKAKRRGTAATIPDEVADRVAAAVQGIIDEFCRRNRWNAAADPLDDHAPASATREQEVVRRTYRDGEVFLRCFFAEHGRTEVRFIDPECIRQPPGVNEQDGWSFGIKTLIEHDETGSHEDLEHRLAYHVSPHDPAAEGPKKGMLGTEIPAREVVHIMNSMEDAETKRGIPAYSFDVADALRRASDLQKTLSISSQVRAATAEIWQHATGTSSQVQEFESGLAAGKTVTNPLTATAELIFRARGGMRRRVPKGQELVSPPASTAVPEYLSAAQGDLRQAGAAFAAPEYMVSADASNGNYSSSQEAGAPFVRNGEAEQEHFKGGFLRVLWKAVRHAVESGFGGPVRDIMLVRELIDIQAEPSQIKKNNDGEIAQRDAIYLQAKVKSPQTVMLEQGLDPAEQIANWQEWEEQMGGQQGQLPMPGDDGQGGGGLGALFAPQSSGEGAAPRMESRERVEPVAAWVQVGDDLL